MSCSQYEIWRCKLPAVKWLKHFDLELKHTKSCNCVVLAIFLFCRKFHFRTGPEDPLQILCCVPCSDLTKLPSGYEYFQVIFIELQTFLSQIDDGKKNDISVIQLPLRRIHLLYYEEFWPLWYHLDLYCDYFLSNEKNFLNILLSQH